MRRHNVVCLFVFALLVTTAQAGEIHDAAARGDMAAIQQLLQQDPGLVQSKDDRDCTSLHFAADSGRLEVVELLLERGAEIEAKDADGDTPLMWAAYAGRANVAERLITAGADLKVQNIRQRTPLHYAGSGGSAEIARLLLAHGADINAQDRGGQTPLIRAVLRDKKEVAELLLGEGADTELRDDYDRTALLLVARETGATDMARLLVDKDADINAEDRFSDTPLVLAAWRGFSGIVDLLIDRGAVIPATGENSEELASYSAERGLVRLFQALVEVGADLSMKNANGGTLLHSACEGESAEIARLLLNQGLDINQEDRYGWTPLHYAAEKGRHEAAVLVLDRGADIDKKTLAGYTPLNIAQEYEREGIVQLLVARGAGQEPPAFPELSGKYFGQKPPGKEPVLFAPDIVASNRFEHGCVTFSVRGDEAFWDTEYPITDSGYGVGRILTSRIEDGHWTPPHPAPFSKVELGDDIAVFAPDGGRLFFVSCRPVEPGGRIGRQRIWVAYKDPVGWAEPAPIDGGPNSMNLHWQFSVAANGSIYFSSGEPGGRGRGDIYVSRLDNGVYLTPENAGDEVNTEYSEGSPHVAPDESYLIFYRNGQPDGVGRADLYISFRDTDGNWTTAVNMGEPVNSPSNEVALTVSPDGKYLFFNSSRNGNNDNYWMDAKIIDDFRPTKLR
jgi:ankyrin repeat protein